jgi:hypothetical protein
MVNVPTLVAVLTVLAPPLAGLGGFFLAGRNDEARDKRVAERERAAHDADRQDRLTDRRHDFQRELLLEMQNLALGLIRSTAKVVMQDQRTLREKGQLFNLPQGLSDESYDAGVAYSRAMVRVLDDALRYQLRDFHNYVSGVEVAMVRLKDVEPKQAEAELRVALMEMTQRYQTLNDAIGAAVRAELGRE